MRTLSQLLLLLYLSIGQYANASDELLDINSADAQQLAEHLPGIGPSKAAAILQWRDENGLFNSVEQLQEVKGIGPKTVEKLRPLIRIGTEAESAQIRSEHIQREQQAKADIHRIIDAARLAATPQSVKKIPRRPWFKRSIGEMLSAH